MSVDCVLCVGIGGVGAGTLPLASGCKFFPNAYPQMFTTLVLLLTQSAVGAPTSAYVDSLDDSRHDVEEELTRRTTTAPNACVVCCSRWPLQTPPPPLHRVTIAFICCPLKRLSCARLGRRYLSGLVLVSNAFIRPFVDKCTALESDE